MNDIQTILPFLKFFVFIVSFTLHELAHGYAAYYCGDTTPKEKGRLSFSPLSHFDLIGSVIVPLIMFISGSRIMLGWGKPVPVDFTKLNKYQHIFTASAGILANIILAIAGWALYHITNPLMVESSSIYLQAICVGAFLFLPINLILCLFNLLPFCPLDGWVILQGLSKTKKENMHTKIINPFHLCFNIILSMVILKVAVAPLLKFVKIITIG